MSPLVSYFIFASVIATSLSVLLVGLTKLKGLPLRAQTRLTGLWLTLHASALALGSGGPWLSNVLILALPSERRPFSRARCVYPALWRRWR